MSQLEQQYDELEQVGCQIEEKLRQAAPDDDILMRQFLGLVNEKNALTCRMNELSLRSVVRPVTIMMQFMLKQLTAYGWPFFRLED